MDASSHKLWSLSLFLPLLLLLFTTSLFRIWCKQNSTSSTIPAHQFIVVKTTIVRTWRLFGKRVRQWREMDAISAIGRCTECTCKSTDLLSSRLSRHPYWYKDFGGSDVERHKRSVPSSRIGNHYRFIESRSCWLQTGHSRRIFLRIPSFADVL